MTTRGDSLLERVKGLLERTYGMEAVVEDVGRRPGQVRAKIQQTADDLGQPGTDPFYGKGRINVGTYATD